MLSVNDFVAKSVIGKTCILPIGVFQGWLSIVRHLLADAY